MGPQKCRNEKILLKEMFLLSKKSRRSLKLPHLLLRVQRGSSFFFSYQVDSRSSPFLDLLIQTFRHSNQLHRNGHNCLIRTRNFLYVSSFIFFFFLRKRKSTSTFIYFYVLEFLPVIFSQSLFFFNIYFMKFSCKQIETERVNKQRLLESVSFNFHVHFRGLLKKKKNKLKFTAHCFC